MGLLVGAAVAGVVRFGLLVAPPGSGNKRSWERTQKMPTRYLAAVAAVGLALVVIGYL